MLHIPVQCPHHRRIEPFEKRDYLVPDEIAFVFRVFVRAVFTPREPMLMGISLNLIARHSEQRTPDFQSFREIRLRTPEGSCKFGGRLHILGGQLLHTTDPAQSRSTHKVQNQGFGIVVSIVRNRHRPISIFPAQPCKPSVAQLPRSHFNARLTRPCVSNGV